MTLRNSDVPILQRTLENENGRKIRVLAFSCGYTNNNHKRTTSGERAFDPRVKVELQKTQGFKDLEGWMDREDFINMVNELHAWVHSEGFEVVEYKASVLSGEPY